MEDGLMHMPVCFDSSIDGGADDASKLRGGVPLFFQAVSDSWLFVFLV